MLGLGVRGIGWRDIEIERLPTGQPAVRLHGRAAGRADQLGMERIAVSITPRIGLRGRHRVRGPDGRRPVHLPARHRGAARRPRAADPRPDRAAASGGRGRRGVRASRPTRPSRSCRIRPVPERSPVGFGRAAHRAEAAGPSASSPFPDGATKLDDDIVAALLPERPARGHKGSFGKLLVDRRLARLRRGRRCSCAVRPAGPGSGLVTLAVPEVAPAAVRGEGRRGDDDGAARGRRRGDRPGAALARILDHEHDALVVGPGLRPGLATAELVRSLLAVAARRTIDARRSCSMPRRCGRWRRWTTGGRATAGRPS